jgi:hypothetical protein
LKVVEKYTKCEHQIIADYNTIKDSLKKRLSYLVIECIHNIIYHSTRTSERDEQAYIIITKNQFGYTIYSSNAVKTKKIDSLVKNLDDLLAQKKGILSNILHKKIQNPEINKNGSAGLGLLTIINKSGKDFKYKVTRVAKTCALFHIELDINYKNYQ